MRKVHEDAIYPDSLYCKRPLEWYVGRHIKMAFQSARSTVEHMWVAVNRIDGDHLIGTLDNDPFHVETLQHGDIVKLSRTQIEAVDLTLAEWMEEVDGLRAEGEYYNRWLGYPSRKNGFDDAYDERLTPRQALRRWRDHVPDNAISTS